MSRSRPELRGLALVVLAYVTAPIVAVASIIGTLGLMSPDGPDLALIVIGSGVAILVEVIVATPILIAFQRYRWGWINGWTISLTGFGAGASVYALPALMNHAVVSFMFSPTTILMNLLVFGSIGLIAALAFRIIAFRRR